LVTYLEFVTPLVYSQRQADANYFDLIIHCLCPCTTCLLLYKLADYGLTAGHVNWFRSYLTDRLSYVRSSGALSSRFEALSDVPQGSVLGPFLFNALAVICVVLLSFPIILLMTNIFRAIVS
jgi:hypothetical protein